MKNLELAIKAALDAGNEIMQVYTDPKSDFQVERKSDNSPLTIADKRAHNAIVKYLETTDIAILSEEGEISSWEKRKDLNKMWIVDPLDGTKEFIKRNGEFTVNIAIVEAGIPVLGVVYLPVKKILYFAEESIGAYKIENIELSHCFLTKNDYIRNAEKLPKETGKNKFTVVASRSHLSPETEEFIAKLKQEHGDLECISSGSSIKIALVAEGAADVYPRFAPTMEWDTAAGDALVRCAGGQTVSAEDMLPLKYNKENLLNPWFIVQNK